MLKDIGVHEEQTKLADEAMKGWWQPVLGSLSIKGEDADLSHDDGSPF